MWSMPWHTITQMNQRSEFVMKAKACGNFRELCREYGISARVGYKWCRRFEQEGLDGLRDRSRRPHSAPEGLEELEVCRIVELRQAHPHWGARKLQELYRRAHGGQRLPSESSIKRVLDRSGLVTKRERRRAPETGRLSEGRKAAGPNDIWTVDFKGWWHDATGRCDPLTIRDEFSRFVLELKAMPDAKTETVREVMERVFERYGLPGVIRSDNGAPFAARNALLGLSRLSVWWLSLGIDLERGRPGCPQDNGAHERMHLDISKQLERAGYEHRQAAFELWAKEFNQERPHEALGMRTPSELYVPSHRRYERGIEKIEYPGIDSRLVGRGGCIRFEGDEYFLSTALKSMQVGIRAVQDALFEVRFCSLILGHIERTTRSFRPILPRKSAT